MMKRLFLVLSTMLLVAGCGVRVLPEEALRQVDSSVDFDEVKAHPERYKGSTLLLGGKIIENKSSQDGSVLEILRYTLDGSGYPNRVDEIGGRFLAVSSRFLDPEVYKDGGLITLTGTLSGKEVRPLNGVEYAYPVFRMDSAHVWSRENFRPDYYSPYYSPFYSPYWYDPFWYDPLWYRYPSYRYPYWW